MKIIIEGDDLSPILLRNLALLQETDLTQKLEKLTLTDVTITKSINDVIDQLDSDRETLIPAITALIADDATQRQRGDALQAAADALASSGNIVDAAHAATLRSLATDLQPVLTALTPAPAAPAAPATDDAAAPDTTEAETTQTAPPSGSLGGVTPAAPDAPVEGTALGS